MTASAPLAPTAEPAWWTLYPGLDDAARALGRPVAHLPGFLPVSIGHPTDTTEAPRHMWVRYRDTDGSSFGVATLPHPDRMTVRPGDTEGVAVGIAQIIHHAGHAVGYSDPYGPAPRRALGPLHLDGTPYAAETCGAAPGVTVRAARLPDGSVIALWGPDTVLDRAISLTA